MKKEWKIDDKFNDVFHLYIDNNCVLSFNTNDKDEKYYFVSNLLNIEYDYRSFDEWKTIDDAKQGLEELVIDFLDKKITYYEELRDVFEN